ncbi:MAG: hypothetical protein JWM93_1353, partial [Frankiales bacterium]|nr:hypothetical protein [Frankiales bacterium]
MSVDPAQHMPLWLLDVDGVVNAVTRVPDPSVWHDWQRGSAVADGIEWPIVFSRTVARTVRRLHEERLAEVRWLTTWGEAANESLRHLLELPQLAVVARQERRQLAPFPDAPGAADGAFHGAASVAEGPREWWKFGAVRRLVQATDNGRSLIWTDDDLRFSDVA